MITPKSSYLGQPQNHFIFEQGSQDIDEINSWPGLGASISPRETALGETSAPGYAQLLP
jgi:hypothetical protein